ncbi:hypothetical protein [Filimonas effusa]|uniref:Uncharacterized protein n=1 Tax=Filimonas effusa TaxID=2508721 RepID=A0A4Q1D0M3_9BACT|nr:hypothetical protein [Filimonas effusa]RXK81303.1 hypothetical protein ESB13_20415 [Filimonas effusa]
MAFKSVGRTGFDQPPQYRGYQPFSDNNKIHSRAFSREFEIKEQDKNTDKQVKSNAIQKRFFLETAHPVKFPEAIENVTGQKIPIPNNVKHLFEKQKQSIKIRPLFLHLKKSLLSR